MYVTECILDQTGIQFLINLFIRKKVCIGLWCRGLVLIFFFVFFFPD